LPLCFFSCPLKLGTVGVEVVLQALEVLDILLEVGHMWLVRVMSEDVSSRAVSILDSVPIANEKALTRLGEAASLV
jgi:hypothetical protein